MSASWVRHSRGMLRLISQPSFGFGQGIMGECWGRLEHCSFSYAIFARVPRPSMGSRATQLACSEGRTDYGCGFLEINSSSKTLCEKEGLTRKNNVRITLRK